MKVPLVDLKVQYKSIKSEVDLAISHVLENTAFVGGHEVKKFEENFANYTDSKYCVSCANGTDALQIALKSLGIGDGDEVIVPANSFIATSESVTAIGGEVVFADVNPLTYNMNPVDLELKITSKTKVVIAVHLYGMPAPMDEIMSIAKKHNLYVIEDAAQAHGAKYKDKSIGSIGDIATFSFYPGKNLGAYGDGGGITTNNFELAQFCDKYANHGRTSKYNHEFEGINSRLDGIQAAVLNVKLNHIEKWTEMRVANADYYKQRLDQKTWLFSEVPGDVRHVYHLFVVRTNNRDQVLSALQENGVSAGIHYPIALPLLDAYKYQNHQPEDFPVSSKLMSEIISLPMYPELSSTAMDFVMDQLESISKEHNPKV